MGWTALLDACVLYPVSTRDLLLRGAERYLYEIRWTPTIIADVQRHLVEDARLTRERAKRLIDMMLASFPDAMVVGYDALVDTMPNHPRDRHVLAAAVVAGADVIVTDNTRHFPPAACEPFGVEVQTANEFLSYSFDLAPEVMSDIFLQQVEDYVKPAFDVAAALSLLDGRLPSLTQRLRSTPRVRAAARLP